MSLVNGTFSVTCDKCGTQNNFPASDSNFDLTSGEEKPMGQENCYSWETSVECDNANCDNQIDIEYEIWEYPVGGFDSDEINVDGGTAINRYDYDFQDEPEQDEY
jgi:hypothetical protein